MWHFLDLLHVVSLNILHVNKSTLEYLKVAVLEVTVTGFCILLISSFHKSLHTAAVNVVVECF